MSPVLQREVGFAFYDTSSAAVAAFSLSNQHTLEETQALPRTVLLESFGFAPGANSDRVSERTCSES